MPWGEAGGTDGGAGSMGSATTHTPNDASAYGGRYSGFDPNTPDVDSQFKGNMGSGGIMENTASYTPGTENYSTPVAAAPQDQFSYLKQLSDMFNNKNPQFAATSSQLPGINDSLGQLTQAPSSYMSGPDADAQAAFKTAHPSLYSWGLRAPGTTSEQMFNSESAAEKDTRMGLVGNAIGNIGGAVMSTMMPAPLRMGMGLASAYKNWDSAKPLESAGRGLAALPGYAGVAGQAMQGNYGSALAGGLTKAGVSSMTAGGLGMGLDASQGKDVRRPAAGLAGYYAGSQLGGPVGGVFGQNLAKMFTRKK